MQSLVYVYIMYNQVHMHITMMYVHVILYTHMFTCVLYMLNLLTSTKYEFLICYVNMFLLVRC